MSETPSNAWTAKPAAAVPHTSRDTTEQTPCSGAALAALVHMHTPFVTDAARKNISNMQAMHALRDMIKPAPLRAALRSS